ncbi:MAG: ribonuclease HII [Fimbriimonas ginsengisoli]|uniref:Ribonuclease HII n=1 Tax=Fimbriimonas ginsengisoli TaxID=1005039 RepID=A0A931LV57_FIMGI|nr:ribonuclease HII [Fimbriimonas ginsengisoli]MBI3721607.1 ribonuclease HII [Fimbriimonas ginsengisoli]
MGRGRLKHIPGAAGVDEAGRGPLAGPVVVAAVILPLRFNCRGLNDSKKLTPAEREEQAARIKEGAAWAVVEVDVAEIDRFNILQATMLGMERAVRSLALTPEAIFVDGNRLPYSLQGMASAVIKADATLACVAAASIIAKTHRDALMRDLAVVHPGYGFEEHFGYSTPQHFEALRRLGPCPIHRRSFAPVQEAEHPCLIFVD